MTAMQEVVHDLLRDTPARRNFAKARSGKEVEDYLRAEFDRRGFNRLMPDAISKEDAAYLDHIRKAVKEYDSPIPPNPFSHYQKHYLAQPNGSQDYPDYLVFCGSRVFAVETKFKANKGPPMWNSGLPRPHGLYLFVGDGKITFFVGHDVITGDETAEFTRYREAIHSNAAETNRRLTNQGYGFSAYPRFAVQQKGTSSNFWDDRRHDREMKALEYCADDNLLLLPGEVQTD